ncbi:MAG: hypothetical protein SGJ24_19595 [Chloroflexota bacterium]|nr:hypothetical protein [Chloroflexota bacterium]
MRRTFAIFGLVFALVLTLAPAAAQTTPTIVCGSLSSDDCAILTASQTATAELTSANFSFNADLVLTDMQDLPDGDTTINVVGSGVFAGDFSAFAMNGLNTTSMMSDPAAQLEMASTVLLGLDAQLDVTINLPQVLLEGQGNMPDSFTLNLILVDGVGYLNFDSLIALQPSLAQFLPAGYAGLDLASAFEMMMPAMANMPMDTEALGIDTEALQAFSDPAFLNRFVQITRDADSTNEAGDAVVVFTSTYDLVSLINDPAYANLLRSTFESQGETMDEATLQQAIDSVSAIIEGVTFTQTTAIGTSDNFVRSIDTNLRFDLSAMNQAMMGMSAESSMDTMTGSFALDFSIDYSNFNTATLPTAPAGAPVVTIQELANLFMGGAQSMPPTSAMTIVTATLSPEATAEVGIVVPTITVPTITVPTITVPTIVVPTIVAPGTTATPGAPGTTETPGAPGTQVVEPPSTPVPTVAS